MTLKPNESGIIPPEQITDPADVEIQCGLEMVRQRQRVLSGIIGYLRVDAIGIPSEERTGQAMIGEIKENAYGMDLTMAEIAVAGIDARYHNKGIGTRLYKAFARAAFVHGGATHLAGDPVAAALRRRDSIFGPENSRFYTLTSEYSATDPTQIISTINDSVDPDEARGWILHDTGTADQLENDRYTEELRAKYGTVFSTKLTDRERSRLRELRSRPSLKARLVVTDMRHADMTGWEANLEVVAPAFWLK